LSKSLFSPHGRKEDHQIGASFNPEVARIVMEVSNIYSKESLDFFVPIAQHLGHHGVEEELVALAQRYV
jgi:(p)ppGpp synthase/HD superfamily hydrolase